MKKIKIIVNGAMGKMGALATATLQKEPEFEVVATLSKEDNLSEAIKSSQADIVVDLTRADCVFENSKTIIENNVHPVIGTSGLIEDQINFLKKICEEKKLGGIIVPNFSIAAVLMMEFSKRTINYMKDVEIIEAHHPQKADAPSGTALKTAEMIGNHRKKVNANTISKELLPGARGALYHQIPIHSLRLSGILAQQEVIFGNSGETLTFIHRSIDRSCFMPGLLLACRQVIKLDRLAYGLEVLL